MRCMVIGLAALGLAGCATQATFETAQVMSVTETASMSTPGDAADDPAVWVNAGNPAASLILGTNKQTGLYVYDLGGAIVQELLVGQLNNVDLRQNLGSGPDIAVASNDSIHTVSVFTIETDTGLVAHAFDLPTGKQEPYGICAGAKGTAVLIAVTYKDGTVQIRTLEGSMDAPTLDPVRTVQLPSQLEGCVFDEANDTLFIGEETFGIWALDLADDASSPVIVDRIADRNGLAEDVEGLSIWHGPGGTGFLVASAQGKDRFVVYDRQAPYTPRGAFHVAANPEADIDKVTHTDGLDVSSAPLGPRFPKGIVVVQDDGNPVSGMDQNFKLVDWRDVEAALGLADK